MSHPKSSQWQRRQGHLVWGSAISRMRPSFTQEGHLLFLDKCLSHLRKDTKAAEGSPWWCLTNYVDISLPVKKTCNINHTTLCWKRKQDLKIRSGLEKWLSGQECLLLPDSHLVLRTHVITHNFSSLQVQGSEALLWPIWVPEAHGGHTYTEAHKHIQK